MKVGVIGLGYWGSKVAKEYKVLLGQGVIDKLILYDSDQQKRNLDSWTDCTMAEGLESLLSQVDAVHICSPSDTHFQISIKAIEHHVNALIEKPITKSRIQAQKIAEKSIEMGLIFQVGHIFRFSETMKYLKHITSDKKYFPEIDLIELRWAHTRVPNSSTFIEPILWDLLPHPLDVIHYLTEEWPVEVYGQYLGPNKANEDSALIFYKLPSGMVASIFLSGMFPQKSRIIDLSNHVTTIKADLVQSTIDLWSKKESIVKKIPEGNTIRAEILNFIEAINTSKNLKNPIKLGTKSVEIIQKTEVALQHDKRTKI